MLASHDGRRPCATATTVAADTPPATAVATATTAVVSTQKGAFASTSAAVCTHAVPARHRGRTAAHQTREKGDRQ